MARLNHLLYCYIIFEVLFCCRPNNDFCSVTQCSIDRNVTKDAIMKCLQNIDSCTNNRNNAGK